MLTVEALADDIAKHIGVDDVDAIGHFGNRFEHWMKWELATAYHRTPKVGTTPVQAIAVERRHGRARTKCDLVLCAQPWRQGRRGLPRPAYPLNDERDVWIELKARSTADMAGWMGLAKDIAVDIERQTKRLATGVYGVYATVALVVRCPEYDPVRDWADRVRERVDQPPPFLRDLHLRSRDEQPDALVASLLVWIA